MTKVQTTNRIRIRKSVLYVSCTIISDIKDHLVRLNQVYAVKKGSMDHIMKVLASLALEMPEHFSPGSRAILK